MKITLMYNPQAGDGRFSLEETYNSLKKLSSQVVAYNTKKPGYMQAFHDDCDLMIIAGGDGTIEKILRKIYKWGVNLPVGILPYGGANNIATSLGLSTSISALVNSWKNRQFKLLSVGELTIGKKNRLFIESVGWGLFAEFLQSKNSKEMSQSSKDKTQLGSEHLKKQIARADPSFFSLKLDGRILSGQFLWVEIMNTPRIGPAITIAPSATTEDRFLNVLLIEPQEKEKLLRCLDQNMALSKPISWDTLKVKEIWVECSTMPHIDDEIVSIPKLSGSLMWYRISRSKEFFRVVDTSVSN